MALINDLKKLLFGAKAVTKSAADKAVESGREAGQELTDKTGELWEKAKEKLEEAGEVILDKTDDAMEKATEFTVDLGSKVMQAADVAKEKAKDFAGRISGNETDTDDVMDDIISDTYSKPQIPDVSLELPKIGAAEPVKELGEPQNAVEDFGRKVLKKSEDTLEKATDFTEDLGSKVLEKGSDFADKFGEKAEEVGGVLFEKSGEVMDKAVEFAEGLSAKILKKTDELVQKAQEEAAKSGDTAESLIDKAKELSQKLEDKITGNNTKFADKTLDMGGSELDKHGSFWEKAERFAKGDHHMKGEQPKPGEMKVQQNPEYLPPAKGKVKGFEDMDGDGDELVDDAIIDDK